MNSFISKQILTTQIIGEQLAKAREGASLSQEEVSLRLGIKERYIAAIEFGLYSELPGEIYALEFVKKYAAFLNMDPNRASVAYRAERKSSVDSAYKLSARGESYKSAHGSRWLGKVFLAAGVMAAFVYGAVLGHKIFAPPTLMITTPEEYTEINSSHIILQGLVEGAKEVHVNTEPIIVSKNGAFMQSYNLPKGINLLKITAIGRFGKESVVYRMIVVEELEDDVLVSRNNE